MSYIPRNHYLVVHDALRKLLGPTAQLAAFVKAQKPFQCHMLVNSARTDPDILEREGSRLTSGKLKETSGESSTTAAASPSPSPSSSGEAHKRGVGLFARDLQEVLGLCDVVPHTRRVDITFRDRTTLQLALGADKADLPFDLHTGADINREPDWRLRNRLRISLGFDEELFLGACTRSMNVAARVVEKSIYDYHRFSALMLLNPKMGTVFEAHNGDWRAVLPPVTYWLAHCYALDAVYKCRHYQNMHATVLHNYAEYYGVFPMDNPYCLGEDLNTMEVVQWVCAAQKAGGFMIPLAEGEAGTPPEGEVVLDLASPGAGAAAEGVNTVGGGK